MIESRVQLERHENGVAVLSLNRPEKLNALDRATMDALEDALDQLDLDESLRVVILTAKGKAFCAGGDITDWGSLSPQAFGHAWVRRGHRLFDRLAQLRLPLIAAINGHALGGGLELAMSADVRIADLRAKFGLPETSIGVVPGWSGTQRLVNRLGHFVVARMALGGEIFSGSDATLLGIIDIVAEEGGVMEAALAYASRVTERSPAANEITKLMMLAASSDGAAAATEALGSVFSARTADRAEGVAAFAAKRKPSFKGN